MQGFLSRELERCGSVSGGRRNAREKTMYIIGDFEKIFPLRNGQVAGFKLNSETSQVNQTTGISGWDLGAACDEHCESVNS